MIALRRYENEQKAALHLIKEFWFAHNGESLSNEEVMDDFNLWTGKGHCFYFIMFHDRKVGFVHLGNRGAAIDWLEDIFVLPKYQNQGIGSQAIQLIETLVKEYSDSLYIEAAAKNEKAIRLYHRLGFNCLNTITIRKDFNSEKFKKVKDQTLFNKDFEIKIKDK